MRCACILAGVLAFAPACECARAGSVYECTGADGAVGFQDQPCRRGQVQRILHLRDAAPPAVAPSATDAPASPPPPAADIPPPAAAAIAAPDFFLCMRNDGSRYLSEDGVGQREAVPFGMLGGSGQSLADAYGGRNGIGVSAPGLRPIPQIPAAQAPFAGAYVWVDDPCHHAGPQEACTYLRDQLDDITGKLRRAFSDTEAQLKQEQAALRERMRGC